MVRTCDTSCLHRNLTIDLTLAKAQRGLDCFDQSRAIFPSDRDAILNDLHTRAEPFGFWIRVVHAHDFVVDPNAQVALLLEEIEKVPRLSSRGDCDPECDKNIFADSSRAEPAPQSTALFPVEFHGRNSDRTRAQCAAREVSSNR